MTTSDQDRKIEELCTTSMTVSTPLPNGDVIAKCEATDMFYMIDEDGEYDGPFPKEVLLQAFDTELAEANKLIAELEAKS